MMVWIDKLFDVMWRQNTRYNSDIIKMITGASLGANSSIPFGISSCSLRPTDALQMGCCSSPPGPGSPSDDSHKMPFLKKWVRTRHAILFRLSNRTVQVLFFDRRYYLFSFHSFFSFFYRFYICSVLFYFVFGCPSFSIRLSPVRMYVLTSDLFPPVTTYWMSHAHTTSNTHYIPLHYFEGLRPFLFLFF